MDINVYYPLMSTNPVSYHRDGHIGQITLNQPQLRNSMSPQLLDAYMHASSEAQCDSLARVVIVCGSGTCFSAGANLNESLQGQNIEQTAQARSFSLYEAFLSTLDIPVPVIAALNGHAVGGGFGLALMSDIRIAHAKSKYGANFARLGIHPGMAITHVLPQLIGQQHAAMMLYTGELIRGHEGVDLGLFAASKDNTEQVLTEALEMAERIAMSSPRVTRSIKASWVCERREAIRAAAWKEAGLQSASLNTPDAKEGIAALLEKRLPRFKA